MNALLEAAAWCLWPLVLLKMLPRLDRIIGLAERGMTLWEKAAAEALPARPKKLPRR